MTHNLDHISEYGVPILAVEGPPDPDIGGYLHYEYGPEWPCVYCAIVHTTENELREHLRAVHPTRYPPTTATEGTQANADLTPDRPPGRPRHR